MPASRVYIEDLEKQDLSQDKSDSLCSFAHRVLSARILGASRSFDSRHEREDEDEDGHLDRTERLLTAWRLGLPHEKQALLCPTSPCRCSIPPLAGARLHTCRGVGRRHKQHDLTPGASHLASAFTSSAASLVYRPSSTSRSGRRWRRGRTRGSGSWCGWTLQKVCLWTHGSSPKGPSLDWPSECCADSQLGSRGKGRDRAHRLRQPSTQVVPCRG